MKGLRGPGFGRPTKSRKGDRKGQVSGPGELPRCLIMGRHAFGPSHYDFIYLGPRPVRDSTACEGPARNRPPRTSAGAKCVFLFFCERFWCV